MHSSLIQSLVHTLALIGLVVAIWLALSPPAYVTKLVLTAIGALTFPARVVHLTGRYGGFGAKLDAFLKRASNAAELAGSRDSVRILIDERHSRLQETLKGAESRVRIAVGNVEGIAGTDSPRAVLKDLDALRERTKLVDQIGVEIDGDIADQYSARARTHMTLIFASLFVVLFVSANGMLLNLFFSDLIAVRLFGLPTSLLLSFMVVCVEMALGFGLAWLSRQPNTAVLRWFVIALVGLMGCFEAVVLGLVSNAFELELPLLDTYPTLKLWMAPLGLVLTTATSLTGYMLHKTLDELAEHAGAAKLQRELKAVTGFVRDLPATWEAIDQKAQRARASIDTYLLTLKGKTGELSGIVTDLRQEREQLSEVLLTAQPKTWPSIIEGQAGDRRAAAAQNIAIFLASVAAIWAFGAACVFLLLGAVDARLPAGAAVGMGAAITLAFYVAGWLSFQRVQIAEGGNGRAYPVRAGALEYIAAGALVLGCAVGLMWASMSVLGGLGIIVGLMFIGVGIGAIGLTGYLAERGARGLTMILTLGLALGALILGLVLAALLFIGLWLTSILAWLLAAIVSLLAKPVELLIEAFKGRNDVQTPAKIAA